MFVLCLQGLEDQLLALVVNKERPDLEETKTQLIIQNTEFTIKLKQLEDELLYKLSTAEGDITGMVQSDSSCASPCLCWSRCICRCVKRYHLCVHAAAGWRAGNLQVHGLGKDFTMHPGLKHRQWPLNCTFLSSLATAPLQRMWR